MMKKHLIVYFATALSCFVLSLLTNNYISGFLMASFGFMAIVTFSEAKEYYARKYNTLQNQFYTMVKNGLSYDEIKERLNISDKTLQKLIDYLKQSEL